MRFSENYLCATNRSYLMSFLQDKKPSTRKVYRSVIYRFMLELEKRDFAEIEPYEFENFADQFQSDKSKVTAIAYLKNILCFIIHNNINNAKEKVRKETLLWMLNL